MHALNETYEQLMNEMVTQLRPVTESHDTNERLIALFLDSLRSVATLHTQLKALGHEPTARTTNNAHAPTPTAVQAPVQAPALVEQTPVEHVDVPLPSSEEVVAQTETEHIYPLQRQMRGGRLGTYYISEQTIREYDYEHGDTIRVFPLGETVSATDLNERCNYELIEKSPVPHPKGRTEYRYCTVDMLETGYLGVKRTAEGKMIKWDDHIVSLKLTPHDIDKWSIEEGDIVDIAFPSYEQVGEYATVVWVHSTEEPDKTVHTKMKEANERKEQTPTEDKTPSVADPALEEQLRAFWKKKKVLLLTTNMNEIQFLEKQLKTLGASPLTNDPNNLNAKRMKAEVKKHDVVILVTSSTSHDAMYKVKDLANQHDTIAWFVESTGRNALVHTVNERVIRHFNQ